MNEKAKTVINKNTLVPVGLIAIGAGIAFGAIWWAATVEARTSETATRVKVLEENNAEDHDLLIEIRADVRYLKEREARRSP